LALALIDNAGVFVADVSIVTPQGFEKPSPNPNVLLELGYALRALGPARIILVANEHFGAVDALPFDLRSRRVLCYAAAPDETDRATPRKKLAAAFRGGDSRVVRGCACGRACWRTPARMQCIATP